MGDGQLDHDILNLQLMLILCVCVCVCACVNVCINKIVDNSEQKIVNNRLLKTSSENV